MVVIDVVVNVASDAGVVAVSIVADVARICCKLGIVGVEGL